MILSISLIFKATTLHVGMPAGAINVGDKVTISAKIQQNMQVLENSVVLLTKYI